MVRIVCNTDWTLYSHAPPGICLKDESLGDLVVVWTSLNVLTQTWIYDTARWYGTNIMGPLSYMESFIDKNVIMKNMIA